MSNKIRYVAIVPVLVFILTGCTKDLVCENQILTRNEITLENASFTFDYQEENFGKTFPNYFISAGDVLDVLFHIQTKSTDPNYQFILETDHKIVIKFTSTPELNEEQYIRPDGTISLPVLGQVKAAGKTVAELQQELQSQYSRVLQNPEIHILVPEFSKRIEELKQDLHTAPRGLSRLVTVRPDGHVTFPMVGEMNVLGKTIAEVNKTLNAGYLKIFRGLQVDLFLEKASGSNVYVLGSVNKVGAYEVTRPITVLEALTLAGGTTPNAQLENIVVMRRNDKEKKVIATEINIDDILNFECGSKNFYLKPYDMVYVPRTGLAETAQIARDLMDTMMFKGWSFNFSPMGDLINTGINSPTTIYTNP